MNARIAKVRPMERADLALVLADAQALSGNNHTLLTAPAVPRLENPSVGTYL